MIINGRLATGVGIATLIVCCMTQAHRVSAQELKRTTVTTATTFLLSTRDAHAAYYSDACNHCSVSIPWVGVSQESSRRRDRALAGFGLGLLGGAIVGGVLGAIAYEQGDDFSQGETMLIFAGFGALVGAPLGAIIGAFIRPEQNAGNDAR